MWMVLMISFWFVLPALVYRRTITFRHQFSMNFTEEGFTLGHEKGSKKWERGVLYNLIQSPHFFHFYSDSRSFILVPKSGCKDIDEVADLRKLIKDHVKRS